MMGSTWNCGQVSKSMSDVRPVSPQHFPHSAHFTQVTGPRHSSDDAALNQPHAEQLGPCLRLLTLPVKNTSKSSSV